MKISAFFNDIAEKVGAIILSSLLLPLPAIATDMHCVPEVKYVCDETGCSRITEGFQHAESFSLDDKGNLSACLWTQCYSARGEAFRSQNAGEMTVMVRLDPDNGSSSAPPLLVSLTLDQQDAFVAVWQYAGQGLTFDHGHCARK